MSANFSDGVYMVDYSKEDHLTMNHKPFSKPL